MRIDSVKSKNLKELTQPLADWLIKNANPHTKIVVTCGGLSVEECVYENYLKENKEVKEWRK